MVSLGYIYVFFLRFEEGDHPNENRRFFQGHVPHSVEQFLLGGAFHTNGEVGIAALQEVRKPSPQ